IFLNHGLSRFVERRDLFTGAFVWQSPIPEEVTRDQLIRGIGLVHGYIVLVGSSFPKPIFSGTTQLVVWVYDEHGTLGLEDRSDQTPGGFADHAISGNRIVGVGNRGGGAFVQMYELQTGGAIHP